MECLIFSVLEKKGTRVERNSRVKHAQAWAVQGWVTSREDGHQVEKHSRVKPSQAWAVQGCVTPWEEEDQGGEEQHS